MTKRTAISIPDELFRQIERARKTAKMDRSTWLQEAAGEYLRRRSREEEIEAYFRGYEREPLTEDELAFLKWNETHFGDTIEERSSRAGAHRKAQR